MCERVSQGFLVILVLTWRVLVGCLSSFSSRTSTLPCQAPVAACRAEGYRAGRGLSMQCFPPGLYRGAVSTDVKTFCDLFEYSAASAIVKPRGSEHLVPCESNCRFERCWRLPRRDFIGKYASQRNDCISIPRAGPASLPRLTRSHEPKCHEQKL